MSNLQIFKSQQLIPLQQNNNGEVIISGRELHEFLKVKQDFSDWIKKQLEMIGAIKNKDFTCFPFKREGNNATLIDYIVTLDIAKENAMIQRNEKDTYLSVLMNLVNCSSCSDVKSLF